MFMSDKNNFSLFGDGVTLPDVKTENDALTFVSTRGEELPLVVAPQELAKYSGDFGYPLSDFEARDIAESISETADFYDLFINREMIEDSIRMCSILHTETSLYKGGEVDFSMIEQYSVLQARTHEVIDLYMPLLDSELKVFLGFQKCEDFDDEYKDTLLNIITDMLESAEGTYKEYSPYEAAYLFFTALNLRYKDDIAEFLEYRDKKVKPGHALSDVADKVFEMYSNLAGGIEA